jgi:pyroglutamyl-peptidase
MRSGSESGGTLVLAGFEPFDGRSQNRSWEVVRRVRARAGLETIQLPVDFAKLKAAVVRLTSRNPRGLLLLGESPTKCVCVEQVALNVLDSDTPDNGGSKPQGEALVPDGPLALPAAWNARMVAQKLNESGIPAAHSFHAGTFACNAALYLALHALPNLPSVGFVHVPHRRWPFGLRLGVLLRAVDICIDALLGQDGASPRR